MSKPNFEMAQNSATNFLLSHNIKSLAFNPKDLNLVSEGIIIDTIENYPKLTNQPITCFIGRNIDDCYVIKSQDYSIILYRENSTVSEEHRTFGIVHELGHIYCGHSSDGQIQEIEANFFAAQVLMPEIVIYYVMYHYLNNKLDYTNLMDMFNVSFDAANKRIATFSRKNFWNSSRNDKLLLSKFKPYIKEYFKQQNKSYDSTYEYLFAI